MREHNEEKIQSIIGNQTQKKLKISLANLRKEKKKYDEIEEENNVSLIEIKEVETLKEIESLIEKSNDLDSLKSLINILSATISRVNSFKIKEAWKSANRNFNNNKEEKTVFDYKNIVKEFHAILNSNIKTKNDISELQSKTNYIKMKQEILSLFIENIKDSIEDIPENLHLLNKKSSQKIIVNIINSLSDIESKTKSKSKPKTENTIENSTVQSEKENINTEDYKQENQKNID